MFKASIWGGWKMSRKAPDRIDVKLNPEEGKYRVVVRVDWGGKVEEKEFKVKKELGELAGSLAGLKYFNRIWGEVREAFPELMNSEVSAIVYYVRDLVGEAIKGEKR
jgi:hypothetical protein